ncbi:polysaccharide biosynthesis/export family protein [Pseudooceanicola sp. C21-150M6]|uniref:polysaccharide biosynthesis/export family protein n=1 Tax=Pseudooceanicola sp. C21-150M6 TaxID=3434355 RepID=UPI003D7FB9F6
MVGDQFAVAQVTRASIATYAGWPRTSETGYPWISRRKQPMNRIIAPGDTVSITIWNTEDNGLLTSLEQRSASLQSVRVSPSGRIFLPYLEELKISGMSPEHAREVIQQKYEEVTPSAQVQLDLEEGRQREVSLVGGVAAPGTYPMPDMDYTLMALLSQGGGAQPALNNPQVRLHRNGKIYGTSLKRLYENPALDTTLVGGDKVILQSDDRTFLSLGATGSEALQNFPKDNLTAAEAISIAGGVSDNRADPRGILVLREYPARTVRADGSGPPNERMIFVVDLTSADGLFSAGKFEILPDDIVYATEASVTSARTVLGLIGSVFGVFNAANNL